MRAFLLGTAIALALLAAAVIAARPAHAAGPAQVTAAAPASSSTASTLQAAVRPGPDASVQEAGWVQYGAFGVALVVLLVIGTGMVPRRR